MSTADTTSASFIFPTNRMSEKSDVYLYHVTTTFGNDGRFAIRVSHLVRAGPVVLEPNATWEDVYNIK